jgi:hypothetical protein
MASDSTGRWVKRAATTGGGRTYRGQAPVNWYASLIVICLVGLLLIWFSRYERTHTSSSSSGQPAVGTQWYAGLGVDLCGTMQPNLPAGPNKARFGLTAQGNGVLSIAPKNASESGQNATLGKFVSGYPGLGLSSTSLQYPGKPAYSNGALCPKGTPDAGKAGVVIVVSWPNVEAKGKGTETNGAPQNLLFTNGQLVTMAFVPVANTVPKPPADVITALLTAVSQGAANKNTATTAPLVTPTSAPSLTTTPTTAAPTTATTAGSGGSSK